MGLAFLAKYREGGLLLLRVSVGVLLILYTAPVLVAGERRWKQMGSAIRHIGFDSNYEVWGFAGALAACVAGILLIFGLFFRAGLLLGLVVTLVHLAAVLSREPALLTLVPAIEICIVLVSLLFIGPGKYSVDKT